MTIASATWSARLSRSILSWLWSFLMLSRPSRVCRPSRTLCKMDVTVV